ncbi:hypothetical protein ACFSHQ_27660 [Gemmobacter lanyuensis]
MQRGSGANGTFSRFADGTLICVHSLTASTTAAVTWTFPSAFVAAPCVTGTVQAAVLACVTLDAAPPPPRPRFRCATRPMPAAPMSCA